MKNPINLIILALSALCIAGCAEQQPPPPTAKKAKPSATPSEFRAVEKPQSYSQ
jgi:hypothetical protein